MSSRSHVPLAGLVAVLALGALPAAAMSAPAAVEAQRRAVAQLEERLAEVDERAGAAAAAHNAALDRRDELREQITQTRRRTRATVRVLDRTRAHLERRLVQMYVSGTPDPVAIILGSDSLSEAAVAMDVVTRAATADAATVTRMRERRAELGRLRTRLAQDAVAVAAQVAVAERHRRELDALLSARRDELAAAQARLGHLLEAERRRQARLAAQRRAERRAAKAAAREAARASAADRPAEASTGTSPTPQRASGALPSGSHVFPIAAPTTFSDDWLAARAGGRYHEGIDLFADRGSPVVAVAGGTVYRVGYSGISGNRFWLRDAAGTTYFYAHLDGFSSAAREGATVGKGTVLGYVGDTGDARGTSPHVHFEIHPGGGGPTRPYPIVSAWPRIG